MQKKTKIGLAAGAAILLAGGAAAGLAQADGMMGGMGHGMWHGRGHGFMMTSMAERYDANKDGKITQDEIDQNRAAWLAEFDADKNGTLSLDEFKNLWLKARQEEMVREFQYFDRDGNAQVTLDEYKSPMSGIVAEMDRNNDGALTRDDHRMMRGRGWDQNYHYGMGRGMMGQGVGHGMMGQGMMNGAPGPAMMDDDDDSGDGQSQP